MVQISDLPFVNATLNGISAAFLVGGYVLIKRGRFESHRLCMLGALSASTLFLPLALVTAARGLRAQYGRHVRVARWTFPLWLYVSVTGVVIYLMLYQMY
jgi:uncharacterized membrane protein YozB (DUF420 family)